MTPVCQRLFVYGTLKRRSRHPMAQYLAEHAAYRGEAKLRARLYNLGRYPGIVPAADAWTFGDLYDLGSDPEVLARLDEYEGVESPSREEFFDRRLAEVMGPDDRPITAWVYWFTGAVRAENWIASGRYGDTLE